MEKEKQWRKRRRRKRNEEGGGEQKGMTGRRTSRKGDNAATSLPKDIYSMRREAEFATPNISILA